MAPRLNKRQQRELDELSTLAPPSGANDPLPSDDDEMSSSAKGVTGAGFSALFTPDEDSEDEASLSATKTRKSKKKKKKNTETGASSKLTTASSSAPSPIRAQHEPPVKNERKALKKARAKERKAGRDELDKALAELTLQYPELQKDPSIPSRTPLPAILPSLLSVSLSHLDSEAEMRKFFGSKVVSASQSTTSGPSSTSSRRKHGTQRSFLAHAHSSWWTPSAQDGLLIVPLTNEQLEQKMQRQGWNTIDDEKWWTVEYSKKYTSVTRSFIRVVSSGDPEGFWDIFGKLPGHADTLLQLSEVYRYREEYSQAVSFVERALFTYERAFVGAFTFTTGQNRLDFDRVENRPFFLALHRQVVDLQRRGCPRTAFEFARLLYSLDPWNDPYGALLHLDYLSLKAGMTQWLRDMFDHFNSMEEHDHHAGRVNPTRLPGWVYTNALILRIEEDQKNYEDHKASTAALREAILSFPAVVPLLADKLDISLSTNIRSSNFFRIETTAGSLSYAEAVMHLLCHLYAQRSFSIWKDPSYCKWFANTVASTYTSPSEFKHNPRRCRFLELYNLTMPLRHSIYRHVLVLDDSYRRLTAFIPKEVLETRFLNCDPLPPPTRVNVYDDEFFAGVDDVFAIRTRTNRGVLDPRILEQLIPDPLLREQLQAFFEANPQRFVALIEQLAQMVGNVPQDVLQDMIVAQAVAGQGIAGDEDPVMPGHHHMPGVDEVAVDFGDGGEEDVPILEQDLHHEQVEDTDGNRIIPDNDDDDEGDDDGEDASMPVRLMRNLINRFLGRTNTGAEEDSSEEDEVQDEADVD